VESSVSGSLFCHLPQSRVDLFFLKIPSAHGVFSIHPELTNQNCWIFLAHVPLLDASCLFRPISSLGPPPTLLDYVICLILHISVFPPLRLPLLLIIWLLLLFLIPGSWLFLYIHPLIVTLFSAPWSRPSNLLCQSIFSAIFKRCAPLQYSTETIDLPPRSQYWAESLADRHPHPRSSSAVLFCLAHFSLELPTFWYLCVSGGSANYASSDLGISRHSTCTFRAT